MPGALTLPHMHTVHMQCNKNTHRCFMANTCYENLSWVMAIVKFMGQQFMAMFWTQRKRIMEWLDKWHRAWFTHSFWGAGAQGFVRAEFVGA